GALADANDAAVRGVRAALEVAPGLVVGMGQSMGGCLSVVTQARRRTFDALAVLGYSAIHTQMPTPDGRAQVSAVERGHIDASDTDRTTAEIGGLDVSRRAL